VQTRRVPLFPLSNVVLFPDAVAPLHIFEPRYRQMLRAALEGDRLIGMTTVRPTHLDEMAGDPPLYPIGCLGFVGEYQRLADGRYNLLLRGTQRFRIREELARQGSQLYRSAEIELLEDLLADPQAAEVARAGVIEGLRLVARHSLGDQADAFDAKRLGALSLRSFAGGVCQAIGLPPQEKQGMLETDDVGDRLRRLESALAFHLAATPSASGSQRIH